MSNKFPGAKLPDPQENRGEREREGERMGRGGIGPHHFSDQSYAPGFELYYIGHSLLVYPPQQVFLGSIHGLMEIAYSAA
jgi:hypothetical protein